MKKNHISNFQKSGFHEGRAAGIGVIEDDYSDEAFPDKYPHRYKGGCNFVKREPMEPSPVIIIREGKKK